jgi:ABC-type lipoprotein release transport system permease subunit
VARHSLVPVILNWVTTVTVAATILSAVVAALWPVWKVSRMRPVEALRAV